MQELWIAAALADTQIGFCGSSPLSLTMLVGDKSQGTDVHSLQAKASGLSRDHTKNLVYGGVYGLGLQGATNQLMRNLPHKSPEECQTYAEGFLKAFKGQRSEHTRRYIGGIASDAFNAMEAIAAKRPPETPVLSAKISWALRCKDFATTRLNWVIQSSGSDWRDMWVVLVAYLFHRYQVDGRLLMTIHDEARFLIKDSQVLLATWLIQVAHLMIRAAFIDALGLDCIPASVAWHSAVDIDTILRKDPTDPQITPSQPEAIPSGYSMMPKQLATLASDFTPEP